MLTQGRLISGCNRAATCYYHYDTSDTAAANLHQPELVSYQAPGSPLKEASWQLSTSALGTQIDSASVLRIDILRVHLIL